MTEFDLIYRYFKLEEDKPSSSSPSSASIIKSIGDDAAVVGFSENSQMVTCIDTLVQGRHFSDDWNQINELAFSIGYKAVAVNISDIAAMGAKPHSLLLALTLPKRLANEEWLRTFAKGLHHACRQFDVRLIGGDTTRHDKLVLSVTANGIIENGTRPIYRNGAKVGDKVYVSGTLGDACYALNHPHSAIGQQLAHRLHMPTPRIHLGQALAKLGNVTSMIDVSDGLAQDLNHICQQSKVAMRLNLEHLPSSDPLQQVERLERLRCQLTGGDDYELAFTLPVNESQPSDLSIDLSKDLNMKVTCIGEVVAHNTVVDSKTNIHMVYRGSMVTENSPYPFKSLPELKGFQHF